MNRCILNQNTILFIARDVMGKYILFVTINEIINSLNFKTDWNDFYTEWKQNNTELLILVTILILN